MQQTSAYISSQEKTASSLLISDLNNNLLTTHNLASAGCSVKLRYNQADFLKKPTRTPAPPKIQSSVASLTSLFQTLLQTVRSSTSSTSLQYPLVSLRSSCSCLRLLPLLPVTSILPSIFPLAVCFIRQFLRKM